MGRSRDQIHLGELIIFRPMPGAMQQVRSIRTPRNAVRKRIGKECHLSRLVVRIGRHDPKVAEAAAPDGAVGDVISFGRPRKRRGGAVKGGALESLAGGERSFAARGEVDQAQLVPRALKGEPFIVWAKAGR